MRSALSASARIVLGAVFVWAGVSKLLAPDPFVTALDWVSMVFGLSPGVLEAAQASLPRAEVVLGLCLLTGLYLRAALWTSGAALTAFLLVLMAGSLQRGGIQACGCFGHRVLDAGGPALWIARNGVLAALAFAAALRGRPRRTLDGLLARGGGWPGMLARDATGA